MAALEILSPTDRWSEVKKKLREYFNIGVTAVLIVDPEDRTISVYRSLTDLSEFTADDVLSVEDVLPGFSLPVADLFATDRNNPA